MSVEIIQADALALPLADDSVDLVVTSPPYFGLRSYQDGGQHYEGQIGDEPTPAEFVDALIAATAEMVRVLKPSGSIWVNLGDKYNAYNGNRGDGQIQDNGPRPSMPQGAGLDVKGIRPKSLIGVPWRYAIRCIDDLGLILRAEVIWSKPNGLPESVTDRVRRSHETWFHFTKQPRYFSAVDEIREPHQGGGSGVSTAERKAQGWAPNRGTAAGSQPMVTFAGNPLGKLPGSVWTTTEGDGASLVRSILEAVAAGAITIEEGERLWLHANGSCPTSGSLTMAAGSGRDGAIAEATPRPQQSGAKAKTGRTESPTNYSSDPSQTDSQSTICAETHHASTPTTSSLSPVERTSAEPNPSGQSAGTDTPSLTPTQTGPPQGSSTRSAGHAPSQGSDAGESVWRVATQPLKVPDELGVDHFAAFPFEFPRRIIRGWSPEGGVVLDPFGGTGTTATVAKALGRHGISVDLSADYCRLAEWRTNDPGELAKAAQRPKPKPVIVPDGQEVLFS